MMKLKLALRMTKRLAFFVLFCVLTGTSGNAQDSAGSKDIRVDISYCKLDVPRFWKQANSNFYLMYSFRIDQDGYVTALKKIRDEVVGFEVVQKCMESWRFMGLSEANVYVANFRWRHGKGWIEMSVSGKGFKHVTMLDGFGY